MEELPLDDVAQRMFHFFGSAVWCAATDPGNNPDYENVTSDGVYPGLAGELRFDLLGDGEAMLTWLQNHLSPDEIKEISQYLDATRQLPQEIFTKRGRGKGFGILHPAWDGQRRRSIELLKKFEPMLTDIMSRLDWDDPQWLRVVRGWKR
jgi:hypothetical protein